MALLHLSARLSTLTLLLALGACGGDSSSTPDSDSSSDDSSGDNGDGSSKPSDAGVKKDASHSTTSSSSSSTAATGSKSDAGGSTSSTSTKSDAGSSGTSTSSASKDAGSNPLDGLGGLLGGLAGDGGAMMSVPKSDGGTPDHCANAICFDVFDCAIFHADALDCGFTRCDGFICKK